MEYQTLTLSIANDIAVVTLNRPDTMNALTSQMRAEITDAVLTAGKSARVVVLTGTGRAFCSGQDLADGVSNAASLDLERTLRDEYYPMLRAIYDCPVPTITALNGAAAGAGANLALASDVVIATESAYFMQAFARIGLMPDAGGTYWLPRMMGSAKAMGAALFADKISAAQADDWGMIWEHVADEAFEDTWKARATYLAKGPTEAFRHIKTAMRGSLENDLEGQLVVEAKLQGKCGMTRDFKEGVVAFLEKRPPHYQGR